MSILYHESARTLTLQTAATTYQMSVDDHGYLRHLYYGRRVPDADLSYLHRLYDRGFSGNPHDCSSRSLSLDTLCQEYSSCGVGDYRVPSLGLVNPDGSRLAELRYVCHEIQPGKYTLPGLPASWDCDGDAETLIVTLEDVVSGLCVKLYYGVFEKKDMITRAAVLENRGSAPLILEKVGSMCLDLPFGSWELLHFHGRHCMERQPERVPVIHGIQTVGSRRGMSSHQHNPFVILCDREANEDSGDCLGAMLLYSGSFRAEVEGEQFGAARLVMSPGDESFRWTLGPGEAFAAPETLLCFASGFAALSHRYHRFVRENVCRGRYRLGHRPVLLNSWEASYFDIRPDRILALAAQAKAVGVELFVLDDGWFQGRKDDNAGLGDWVENREKLPEGLGKLIADIRALDLQFGLWVEPEMVNEDSDLYRAHPDWALAAPGRPPMLGRSQLVLDLSRLDVQDFIIDFMSRLLSQYEISYIKWDMNRSLSDLYSHKLPYERQGEVAHRCVLGVYRVLETLTSRFPDVLFEGCAGGGGRFDAGMLHYMPQIWCSDDTDAIARLAIQYGTSFGYPVSAVGSHVSAVPNHQTARTTPISTRAIVAMAGSFGYELDLGKLSEDELDDVREQIRQFREDEALLHEGEYYRLSDLGGDAVCWLLVSPDRESALLSVVVKNPQANAPLLHYRLKGLDPKGLYTIREDEMCVSGAALMHGGYTLPQLLGDYPAVQLHLRRVGTLEDR